MQRYSQLSSILTVLKCDSACVTLFMARFCISAEAVYLQGCLNVTGLVPRETAAVSARSVYTIQPCNMSHYFMQSHIRRVHACLVVTCHQHFWKNDRDLLHATAVTNTAVSVRDTTDRLSFGGFGFRQHAL